MNIEIRPENENEYFETEAMVRRSFFNKHQPGCDEHLMVHVMRDHPLYLKEFSRVAVADGRIVGMITYFMAKIVNEDGEIPVPSFGPLCVDHKYKNHGIGGKLLEETLPLLKEAGYPGVIIFGEPEYYPKHGFQRAGTFGLTDAEGNVYDAFMGIEFVPGALSIPGGRFIEPEDLCSFDDEDVNEFDKNFEFLLKTQRPCQWSYPNASDEKNGYHLEYAVAHPTEFEELFGKYVQDLALYADDLKGADASIFVEEIRNSITDASYVIFVGKKAAGLLVTAVPAEPVGDTDCTSYIQELYVLPEFRRRGIAKDILLTFLKTRDRDTGFCITKGSPSGEYFKKLLQENGYKYRICPEDEYRDFIHIEILINLSTIGTKK